MSMSEGSGEITVKNNGELGEEGMIMSTAGDQESSHSQFPEGLRVLLVDDDRVSLAIVSQMLKKCRYQVTATSNSREALTLLKKKEAEFDTVFTNVQMDEIDGFKILEAGLELDIPVVMMSSDANTNVVKKGIMHGAQDYLIKPLRMEEVRSIWKHVFRKNIAIIGSPRAVGGGDQALEFGLEPDNDAGPSTIKTTVKTRGSKSNKRRKSAEDSEDADGKRERIRWSKPLHDKFMDAVEKAGGPMKAVPKQIVEAMGIDNISREQVASHLQKCRKNLTKIQNLETRQNNNHCGFLIPPPPPPPQLPGINNYQQFRGIGYHPNIINNNNIMNCPPPHRQLLMVNGGGYAPQQWPMMMQHLPHHQHHAPIGPNNFQHMIMRGNYNYNNNVGGQDCFNNFKIEADDHGVNPEHDLIFEDDENLRVLLEDLID